MEEKRRKKRKKRRMHKVWNSTGKVQVSDTTMFNSSTKA
jgi:hypothetical protein